MKYCVVGAGHMGYALAYDLSRSPGVDSVTVADRDLSRAVDVCGAIGSPLLIPAETDAFDAHAVRKLFEGHDCVIGAVSYRANVILSRGALETGVHFLDLGGNDEILRQQIALNNEAEKKNILIVPNCGLAPGFVNSIAVQTALAYDMPETVAIRVGGLPLRPLPPLNYQIVFSAEGLLNEYSGHCSVVRDGVRTEVPALSEPEEISFPEPFEALEAFHTSGGASLVPELLEGKVRHFDYKTIRYKGHRDKFKELLTAGFGESDPIVIGRSTMTMREMFIEMLKRKLPAVGEDVVLIRITVEGILHGKRVRTTYQCVDSYDVNANITAMMRTTAFPTSIFAQLVTGGQIPERGVRTPEQCVPLLPFIEEMEKRNIRIHQTKEEIA